MQLKTIQDYYNQILALYPSISMSDIKRILLYGFKSLYLHNSYGGDVLLNLLGFWFYIGQLMNDSLKYFDYYKRKLRTKLRVLYKRKQVPWNHEYYFALTLNLYQLYILLKNKKGRPKKWFTFEKVILYKIYDECNIMNSDKVAIFKIPYILDMGFSLYKEKLKTNQAELILIRKPLTFNDILITNYNYSLITN